MPSQTETPQNSTAQPAEPGAALARLMTHGAFPWLVAVLATWLFLWPMIAFSSRVATIATVFGLWLLLIGLVAATGREVGRVGATSAGKPGSGDPSA